MNIHPYIKEFIEFAKKWFKNRGWSVLYVLEFGSRSRGENIESSDYDLSFCVYSPGKIIIPRYIYPDSKWQSLEQNPLFQKLQLAYPNCELTGDVDFIGELHSSWGNHPEIIIEGNKVATDVRWLTQNLAEENKYADFLIQIFGDIVFDTGFCRDLRKIVFEKQLFHSDGILKIISENVNESIKGIISPKYGRAWISYALDALLCIMIVHSLKISGKPLWHKNDVLSFMQINFPSHFMFATHLYSLKTSVHGRKKAEEFSTKRLIGISTELEQLRDKVFVGTATNAQSNCQWIENNRNLFVNLIDNIKDYL